MGWVDVIERLCRSVSFGSVSWFVLGGMVVLSFNYSNAGSVVECNATINDFYTLEAVV